MIHFCGLIGLQSCLFLLEFILKEGFDLHFGENPRMELVCSYRVLEWREGFDLLLERTQGQKLFVPSLLSGGVRSFFWERTQGRKCCCSHIPKEARSNTLPSNRDHFEALDSSSLWMKDKMEETTTTMAHMQGAINTVSRAAEENRRVLEGMR